MIGALGIGTARDLPINDGGNLPNMADTIKGWFVKLVLGRVTTTIVDHEAREVIVELTCMGVVQPFASKDLKIKPEGERSWKWQMLHTLTDVALKNGEYFFYKNVKYRVMGALGYSAYGYFQYEIVEGYVGPT